MTAVPTAGQDPFLKLYLNLIAELIVCMRAGRVINRSSSNILSRPICLGVSSKKGTELGVMMGDDAQITKIWVVNTAFYSFLF